MNHLGVLTLFNKLRDHNFKNKFETQIHQFWLLFLTLLITCNLLLWAWHSLTQSDYKFNSSFSFILIYITSILTSKNDIFLSHFWYTILKKWVREQMLHKNSNVKTQNSNINLRQISYKLICTHLFFRSNYKI